MPALENLYSRTSNLNPPAARRRRTQRAALARKFTLSRATLSISRVLGVLGLALLGACTHGTPSEGDGKKVFENLLEHGRGAKVASFKKVNGQQVEQFGVKAYSLDFEAMVEYPKGFHPECINAHGMQGLACMRYLSGPDDRFLKEGAKQKIAGSINFMQTEKGWKGEDGNVY